MPTFTDPVMPDSTSLIQTMGDKFSVAGSYAVFIIGAAVSLGVISILGMFTWRLVKKWLSSAK